MVFKRFSLRWWWYGLVEDLHHACEKELRDLEDAELRKGHNWLTPKGDLPHGWYSISGKSLHEGGNLQVCGPYQCLWESPQHRAIRGRYAGKIFQRYISFIPQIVGIIGGLLGIVAFIMQYIKCVK